MPKMKQWLAVVSLACITLLFQNCGGGFESISEVGSGDGTSISGGNIELHSPRANVTISRPIPLQIHFKYQAEGFALEHLTVENAAAQNFREITPGRVYAVDLVPEAAGLVRAFIAEGLFQHNGQPNAASGAFEINFQTPNPVVTLREGTYTTSAVKFGNHVYAISEQTGLRIYNVANLNSPVKVATLSAVNGSSLKVVNSTLVVGNANGINTFSLQNPAAPALLGTLPVPGNTLTKELAAQGNNLIVRSGNTLNIVSLADPANPQLLSSIQPPANGLAFAVDPTRPLVYFGDTIYDISNPQSPALATNLVNTFFPFTALAVAPAGNRAYYYLHDNLTTAEILALDVANVAQPQVLNRVAGSAILPADELLVAEVTRLSGDVLLVNSLGANNNKFKIHAVNFANAAAPVLVSSTSIDYAAVTDLADNLALIVMNGLEILDFTNPAAPAKRGAVHYLASPDKVCVSGAVRYVGGNNQIEIHQTQGEALIPVNRLVDRNILSCDSNALIAKNVLNGAVEIYSLGNALAPALVGTINEQTANSALKSGNLLYVTGDGFLATYNIANPAMANQVSRLQNASFEPYTRMMDVHGNRLIIQTGTTNILVVNVADATAPALQQVLTNSANAVIHGDYLYSIFGGNLNIYNLTDANSVTLAQSTTGPAAGFPYGLSGKNGYLFVAGNNGFQVFEALNPLNPTSVYSLDGDYRSLNVSSARAYLSSGAKGLVVLKDVPGLY